MMSILCATIPILRRVPLSLNAAFRLISVPSSRQIESEIRKLIDAKEYQQVLSLFDRHVSRATDVTWTLALKACTKLRDVQRGQEIHRQLSQRSLQNPSVQTSLIHFYMQSHDVDRAHQIFTSIRQKTVFMYGAMFKGYISNGIPEKVLELFPQMTVEPDRVISTILFNACAKLSSHPAMELGDQLLSRMPHSYFSNPIVMGSAIHMLMRFAQVHRAEDLFSKMKKRDVSTYGVMINGFYLNEQPARCLQLFQYLRQHSISIDEAIAMSMVGACSQLGMVSTCRSVVSQIPLRSRESIRMKTALISMWGKAGAIDESTKIFQSIHQRDVVLHNAMIDAYARNGKGAEAVEIYSNIPEHFRDAVSHGCVLNACSHAGLIEEARSIFDQIATKTKIIFTTMIDCLARVCMFDEAQALLDRYETSNSPSLVMYMALLSGARNHRQSTLSKDLYTRMKFLFPSHKSDLISASILLANTYASVGDYQQASDVRLHRLKHYGEKTQPGVAWTEVNGQLSEFCAHDCSHERSKEIHEEMVRLADELKQAGHHFDSTWVIRPLREDETVESVLCGHSEKLALAFNLLQRPAPAFIQITKNLRICGDCHAATKLIAQIRQCDIVIRDANRIHHFQKNGQCCCGDHF